MAHARSLTWQRHRADNAKSVDHGTASGVSSPARPADAVGVDDLEVRTGVDELGCQPLGLLLVPTHVAGIPLVVGQSAVLRSPIPGLSERPLRETGGVTGPSWEELQRRDEARRTELLRLGTVKLEHAGQLLPPDAGLRLVTSSVAWAGEVVALWARDDEMAALEPDWENYPESRARTSWGAVVAVHGSQTRVMARIKSLSLAQPFVQVLPHDQVLVVGARCKWTAAGAERNALVYDSGGRMVAQATLGDGIEHLRTTSTGNVWVGYSDEGIYGNYGWGGIDGPDPIGSSGIVCFTSHLEKVWEYSHGNGSPGPIDDCYAMNVDGESVWAYCYSDFPIVRIENGSVRAWTNEVAGPGRLPSARTTSSWLAVTLLKGTGL